MFFSVNLKINNNKENNKDFKGMIIFLFVDRILFQKIMKEIVRIVFKIWNVMEDIRLFIPRNIIGELL